MLDLNAMFGEFLSKAVADAVAVHTAELKNRIEDLEREVAMAMARSEDNLSTIESLESSVDELADRVGNYDSKVDEDDVERMIENSVEEYVRGYDLVSLITESDEFEDAVRDALVNKLQA